tara:strand:+ start:9808 stop:10449 length:642 start_codon:yes stop_codon:yes gene_type:complete
MKKKLEFNHCLLIIAGILVLDQFLKVYIKLNFPLTIYSDQIIFDYNWFKLLFVENKGMAWGASINDFLPFIGERSAKLILTLFRVVAIGFIFFWLKESIKSGLKNINSIVLSLILAGAIGNAIDSIFYGYIFTDSYFKVATLSLGRGYESLFHGSVVDMFQFPMFNWTWPSWFPFVGGENFVFFEPVFNIADASISIAIFLIIINYRTFFTKN